MNYEIRSQRLCGPPTNRTFIKTNPIELDLGVLKMMQLSKI